MPAFPDLLGIGAAVLGVATWIVPWVRYLLESRKTPKSSLASVGRVIGLLVLAGCLSAAGLLLALLAFAFVQDARWAWLGLGAIVGFWLSLVAVVGVASLRSRDGRA